MQQVGFSDRFESSAGERFPERCGPIFPGAIQAESGTDGKKE